MKAFYHFRENHYFDVVSIWGVPLATLDESYSIMRRICYIELASNLKQYEEKDELRLSLIDPNTKEVGAKNLLAKGLTDKQRFANKI